MSLQRGINLRALAEKMGQCSGAEVRGICTEAGMYALRERRQHVTQEDFEFAVAKVRPAVVPISIWSRLTPFTYAGLEKEPRGQHVSQQVVLVVVSYCIIPSLPAFVAMTDRLGVNAGVFVSSLPERVRYIILDAGQHSWNLDSLSLAAVRCACR